MLEHKQVWAAIDALAERNGMSPSGLARRAGLDPTTFNKSKRHAADGRPRWPSTESIAKILRATNSTIFDLFGGTASNKPHAPVAIPLLGEAHAGFAGAMEAGAAEAPMPQRIVTFPDTRYDPLYALSVTGDSMQPLYRDGDVLFVSPKATPNVGDRVVVKLQDGNVLVKTLKGKRGGSYEFHAANPDHDDAVMDSASVEWVARIVYATQ